VTKQVFSYRYSRVDMYQLLPYCFTAARSHAPASVSLKDEFACLERAPR
jgi:hypothetical protein